MLKWKTLMTLLCRFELKDSVVVVLHHTCQSIVEMYLFIYSPSMN